MSRADLKHLTSKLVLVLGVLLATASAVWAGGVSMQLTSAGSTLTGTNVMDNDYVGAYTATINGVSTPVICDDYNDETYLGESWTANASTFSNLSLTTWASKFPSNYTSLYEQAAWLTEQMISPANQSQIGEIQYAIWGVFAPSAITNLTNYNSSEGAIAQSWLGQAEGQKFTLGEFSNITVYTPANPSDSRCGNQACPTPIPQEFLVVGGASEPGSLVNLAADLILFGGTILLLRRLRILSRAR